MSQLCKDKISCPNCQTEGEFDYWSSVNVDLDPELKKKIFNEEIFIWTCPKCGAKVFIPFGTLYHDMSHKFMIFFSHTEDEEKKDYEMWAMPEELGLHKDYILRVVKGLLNFKEKILILENGLNDIAVEKLKYTFTHHTDPSMVEKGWRLYFEGITKPDKDNEYGQIVFYRLCPNDEDSCHLALPMEKYYEQCLSLKLDKRFAVGDCACVDEEWISRKIKEVE